MDVHILYIDGMRLQKQLIMSLRPRSLTYSPLGVPLKNGVVGRLFCLSYNS